MATMKFMDAERSGRQDLEASVVILTAIYGTFLVAIIALNVGF